VDGDYLLAFLYLEPDRTVTPPSGWVEIGNPLLTQSGVPYTIRAFRKRASGEPSSWQWLFASTYRVLHIGSWSKAERNEPEANVIDGSGSTAQANDVQPAAPSLSPTVAPDTLVCWFTSSQAGDAGVVWLADTPSNMTRRATFVFIMCDRNLPDLVATGIETASISGGSPANPEWAAGISVLLKSSSIASRSRGVRTNQAPKRAATW
jgi:hypothetical protein